MNDANGNQLTPEEVENIRSQHLDLLKKSDVKARERVRALELDQEQGEQYDELRKLRFEEEEKIFQNDPRYVLVTDEQGYPSYVLKEHAESRTHRKKVRKKHRRSFKSFVRDYVSIALIIAVMLALSYYAYVLTP